ncbi:saccharopine dehydrogenase NADP-binding domain-containing protein [Acidiferrobacter sp.]|jgi:saccharopine dehydrogenase-like NADP-dependent oxidoreductase|uniref:saccharopine dehydrogenase family protein n=1 Tax=Acidiferrobacter sp. TaxID=1872107 RepID=UPI00261FC9E8|nr:saccharopine dehydrogenase NADP-binding domain-containing protein [Acidiferrobacter sp.]
MMRKVLILGGYGTCGQRITEILMQDPQVECIIGGRDTSRGQVASARLGVPFVAVDIQRQASLNTALDGVFAVVNTCGPFRPHDYAVAERCARRGVHYVDMADETSYILGMQGLAARAVEGGASLVSGAGSALAFSSVLAAVIAPQFDTITDIEIAALSGNRNPRGLASVRALLAVQGRPARIYEHGAWREVPGYTKGRTVDLPGPLGRHRLYVTDAPEVEILSRRYGAGVTYRTGFELAVLNRAHAWLGSLNRLGVIADPARFAKGLHIMQKGLRRFGKTAFGLRVVLRGERGGQPLVRSAGLVGGDDGLSILCTPATALVRKWMAGAGEPGAFACSGVLTLSDMTHEWGMRQVMLHLS